MELKTERLQKLNRYNYRRFAGSGSPVFNYKIRISVT